MTSRSRKIINLVNEKYGKLNKTQRLYSAYDRELLAIYEGIKHYRYMIEGRNFTIHTDHKPLIYAFEHRDRQCSPRQYNQLDFISQFSTEIKHISGKDNITADALSRIEAVSVIPSNEEVAKEQEKDQELMKLLSDKNISPIATGNYTRVAFESLL